MIEIDEYARQAIESPVAQPPEMARLVALANRHRRNRTGIRAALALGLASVAVAVIVAVSSLPTDNGGLHVTATSPKTATPTATNGSSESQELTIADLSDRLARAGLHVAADGTAPGFPFAAVAHLLCVDGTQVRVYQYADAVARGQVSAGISPDGSQVVLPSTGSTTTTMIIGEWIGPPHFFAKGRIIVLVLQDEERVLRTLTRILGPTVSPRALRSYLIKAPCATRMP